MRRCARGLPHQGPVDQAQGERAVVHQLPFRRGARHGVRAGRDRGVDRRGQRATRVAALDGPPVGEGKKTAGMIDAFNALWEDARPAFAQERTWRRGRTLAVGASVGLNFRDEKTVPGFFSPIALPGKWKQNRTAPSMPVYLIKRGL